ncbi:eCIS core domain-containing protein [Sorangium sp. So ce341]|uniref:eCIS core domain-containing protein n=1 Tax=Sorangium sp. So ce341 TaxID=3133302 RepID=UPI003F638B6A
MHALLRAQQTMGNQAVAQWLQFAGGPAAQRKALLGAPGDRLERQADDIADSVVRSSAPTAVSSPCAAAAASKASATGAAAGCGASQRVQRKCTTCGGVEAAAAASGTTVHAAPPSSGAPLAAGVRARFEASFGFDFSRVRLHSGGQGAASATALGARAYTVGHDIVFGPGESADADGGRLLAHELAHVVQQSSGLEGHTLPSGQWLSPAPAGRAQFQLLPAEERVLCTVICACNRVSVGKDVCATAALTAAGAALNHVSTLKAQINYDMTQTPPAPIMSRSDPRRVTPSHWPPGQIHQIPNFRPGTGMVRRPDVVAVIDPTAEPRAPNIRAVVDIKFPPDTWRPGQREAYQQIAGTAPVLERGPSDCDCRRDDDTDGEPVRVPVELIVTLLSLAGLKAMLDKLRGLGGRLLGGAAARANYAYVAAALVATAVLLTSEDAQAEINIAEGEDPILALLRFMSSSGVAPPEELRAALDADPALRERVREAMRRGDRSGASRELNRAAMRMLSAHVNEFSREELETLLTMPSAGGQIDSVTLEAMRARLRSVAPDSPHAGGAGAGGDGAGSVRESARPGGGADRGAGRAGGGQDGGAGGAGLEALTPAQRARIQRNPEVAALFQRLIGPGPGLPIDDTFVAQFVAATAGLGPDEREYLVGQLSPIGPSTTLASWLADLAAARQRFAERRVDETAARAPGGDGAAAGGERAQPHEGGGGAAVEGEQGGERRPVYDASSLPPPETTGTPSEGVGVVFHALSGHTAGGRFAIRASFNGAHGAVDVVNIRTEVVSRQWWPLGSSSDSAESLRVNYRLLDGFHLPPPYQRFFYVRGRTVWGYIALRRARSAR